MKRAACFAVLIIMTFVLAGFALAEENTDANLEIEDLETLLYGEEEIKPYEFPRIRPELLLSTGYRFVGHSGARSAIDYEHLEDSVTVIGEARVFRFPNRLYFIFDLESEKDYFGEVRYAWSDVVFFRSVNRMLTHNIGRVTLVDLGAPGSPPDVAVRDQGVEYGVDTTLNNYFLRLRPHDFPAHAFFEYWSVNREGREQDVSLLGSGFFNDVLRVSQRRDVDRTTEMYTFGANSHIGLFEAEYRHAEKSFKTDGRDVLFDNYTASGFRPAGAFPHGLVPEQEGSSDTLKVHTSYSGRLFATATLSLKERRNNESGAEADYFIGSGGLMWMPVVNLSLFFKYFHKEVDVDNPSAARPSVDSITDTASVTARYRPMRGLTLKGGYTYENASRDGAGLWNLRTGTEKNVIHASADTRLPGRVKVNLDYTYTEVDDPSYNTEPDYSNAGKVLVTWNPSPSVNTLFSYNFTHEKRGFLRFSETNRARDREVESGRLTGIATFLVGGNVSLTASYAFMHNNIEQDLVFDDLSGPLPIGIDRGVEYEDKSHSLSLDVSYAPSERLNFNTGLRYTDMEGNFSTRSPDLAQPVSIESFSETEGATTEFSASGEYRSKGGYGVGVEYKYEEFDETSGNPFDDIEGGEVHIVMLTLSKRWE